MPNGFALDYRKRQSPPPEFNRIVLSGVMSYPPNSDAAIYLIEKILPLLRPSLAHLEVIIVGPNPTPRLVEAAGRHGDPVLTGHIEGVRPYPERAKVFVAPLRYASGMQNKVLEAMAMEVPVVTTRVVAAGCLRRRCRSEPAYVFSREDKFLTLLLHCLLHEADFDSRSHGGLEQHTDEEHFCFGAGSLML